MADIPGALDLQLGRPMTGLTRPVGHMTQRYVLSGREFIAPVGARTKFPPAKFSVANQLYEKISSMYLLLIAKNLVAMTQVILALLLMNR